MQSYIGFRLHLCAGTSSFEFSILRQLYVVERLKRLSRISCTLTQTPMRAQIPSWMRLAKIIYFLLYQFCWIALTITIIWTMSLGFFCYVSFTEMKTTFHWNGIKQKTCFNSVEMLVHILSSIFRRFLRLETLFPSGTNRFERKKIEKIISIFHRFGSAVSVPHIRQHWC